FQAEDGIRGRNVTGVQTCALPILCGHDAEYPSFAPSSRPLRGVAWLFNIVSEEPTRVNSRMGLVTAIHRKAVPTESSYLPNSRVATECLQSGQLNVETHRAGAGGRVQRGKTTAGTYQAEDRSPGCTAYSALAEHDFRGSG